MVEQFWGGVRKTVTHHIKNVQKEANKLGKQMASAATNAVNQAKTHINKVANEAKKHGKEISKQINALKNN